MHKKSLRFWFTYIQSFFLLVSFVFWTFTYFFHLSVQIFFFNVANNLDAFPGETVIFYGVPMAWSLYMLSGRMLLHALQSIKLYKRSFINATITVSAHCTVMAFCIFLPWLTPGTLIKIKVIAPNLPLIIMEVKL